jgi:hypothetical protein
MKRFPTPRSLPPAASFATWPGSDDMNGLSYTSCRRRFHRVAGLAFIFVFANIAAAQEPRVPFEQGTHAFRFILNNLELKPVSDINQLQEEAGKSILIVFGETQVLDNIPGGLQTFLENGGALLVATDRDVGRKWQRDFQTQFTHEFVHISKELGYKNNPQCPIVKPLNVQEPPIFENLNQVATNRPVYFNNHSKELKTIAVFPEEAWVEKGGARPLLRTTTLGKPAAFAAAGSYGRGRVIVLSDHSVFINEMMIQTDNDNFDFAYQCVDWLRREGDSQRTQVLLLDEGETVTSFDIPVTDVPMPPIGVINQMLVKMEQENLFNKIALGEHLTERFPGFLRGLVVALTTALAGFGCYRFLMARYVVDPKEPLFSNKMAKQTPDIALTVQRNAAMIKTDNFWEAAHHLARDWFLTNVPEALLEPKGSGVFFRSPSHDKGSTKPIGAGGLKKAPDPFEHLSVDATWWRRRSWMKKLHGICQIATGPPRRLPAAEFARFVTDLEEVKAALARGALHFKTKAD